MVIIEIINSDFESLPFTFILNAPVLFWKLTACLCVPRTRQLSSKIVREFKNLILPFHCLLEVISMFKYALSS